MAFVILVLMGVEARGQAAKELINSAPSTNSVAGVWKATATLADFGDIFQPHHGTRRRAAVVHFKQDGDKLTGHSVNPRHNLISSQPDWEGNTEFNLVRFSDNVLLIEFGVDREGRQERIRIDAVLKDGKLVGRWRNLTGDGAEIFSGGWEAVRAVEPNAP